MFVHFIMSIIVSLESCALYFVDYREFGMLFVHYIIQQLST
jgi:hypothetical protein